MASASSTPISRRWALWLGLEWSVPARSLQPVDDAGVGARLFAADVAGGGAVAADEVGHVAGHDLPQPGDELGLVAPLKCGEALMGLQQRLLHQVRRISLAAKRPLPASPGQQPQVVAVTGEEAVKRLSVRSAGGSEQIGDGWAKASLATSRYLLA